MIRILTMIFCLMTLNACGSDHHSDNQPNTLTKFFNKADTFLRSNIKNGKVAYSTIKQDPDKLNELVKMIGNLSLTEAKSNAKKAFYINAYNILTIHSIIENGIPESPMDVKGFFDDKKHNISGKKRTLDQIEKGILFTEFDDARIHFAVVCAAVGCPQIRPFAYRPGKLDKQLNQAAKETLNRDYFIRVDNENKSVKISMIFKWYKKDFTKKARSVLSYINRYRNKKVPPDYTIAYYDYDWSLNNL